MKHSKAPRIPSTSEGEGPEAQRGDRSANCRLFRIVGDEVLLNERQAATSAGPC